MPRTLIIGCGYVGHALGLRLAEQGHKVTGTRRNPPSGVVASCPDRATLATEGLQSGSPPNGDFTYAPADVLDPESLSALDGNYDYCVYAVSAGGFSDEAYRDAYVTGVKNTLACLEASSPSLVRFVFVGSSGVFHQNDGEIVTEESPTEPTRFSGRRLLEGEAAVHACPLPSTVVRLSGIYGPGRTRLIDQIRSGEAQCMRGSKAVLNHIHRDDCAGAIAHVLQLDNPASLYLGTDCEPVLKNHALVWLADRLGVAPPPEVEGDGSAPKRGGHRFYDNARLLDTGYAFQYPTYREGYGALIDAL